MLCAPRVSQEKGHLIKAWCTEQAPEISGRERALEAETAFWNAGLHLFWKSNKTVSALKRSCLRCIVWRLPLLHKQDTQGAETLCQAEPGGRSGW